MNFDPTKFKMGSGVVSFDGDALGGTKDAPKFDYKTEFYESKCDQNGGQPARKIVTAVKVTITATFKEITTAMTALLGAGKKIDTSLIGSDIYAAANRKALLLTPIAEDDTDCYSFPAAVLLPQTDYSMSGTEEHGVTLTWEALADAEGTIMEIVAPEVIP